MQALNKKLAANNKTNDFQTYRYDASLLFVLEKQGREMQRSSNLLLDSYTNLLYRWYE